MRTMLKEEAKRNIEMQKEQIWAQFKESMTQTTAMAKLVWNGSVAF